VQLNEDGSRIVRAAPLRDVATATSALVRTLLLAGGVVLMIGAGATWWTVRHAMAPVDEMVGTAEAIAGGELTRRIPEGNPATELGRLGVSLNEMLAHLEDSIVAEREGRDRVRRFAADASHELRTPLTVISGYAELKVRGGLESREAEDKAWSRIESESKRMASLIEDLLTLARMGRSRPLRPAPLDLMELVRHAADDHAAIDANRPIRVEGPESLPLVGDEQRLSQVVTSLLANARVHTPPGTTVEIRVVDAGNSVHLVVADDGPGIPDASLGQVFDRFFRADPSRSRSSGGAGLGLSIVQAIVDAHSGTVSAGNVDGGGARIVIDLPKQPMPGVPLD
jgi:two-component system, OmpR family, sensor kinase